MYFNAHIPLQILSAPPLPSPFPFASTRSAHCMNSGTDAKAPTLQLIDELVRVFPSCKSQVLPGLPRPPPPVPLSVPSPISLPPLPVSLLAAHCSLHRQRRSRRQTNERPLSSSHRRRTLPLIAKTTLTPSLTMTLWMRLAVRTPHTPHTPPSDTPAYAAVMCTGCC